MWGAKAADMQQEQEAETNMAVCPKARLQSVLWKHFTRADINVFEKPLSMLCHVKLTKFKIFRKGKTSAIPARKQWRCCCSQTESPVRTSLLGV